MKIRRVNTFIIMIFIALMTTLCGCRILEIRPSTEEEVEEAKEQGVLSDDATTDDTVTVTCEVTDEEILEIPITEEFFPDSVFRQYVSDTFDLDNNDVLSKEERIKPIQIIPEAEKYSGLMSLQGIEYFPNAFSIYLKSQPICELDISNNPNITSLIIEKCNIQTIDISSNQALIDSINLCDFGQKWEDFEGVSKLDYCKESNNQMVIVVSLDQNIELITGNKALTPYMYDYDYAAEWTLENYKLNN